MPENKLTEVQLLKVYDKESKMFIESRKSFIETVMPILVDKCDFWIIKGKKCLAKGGAEKLATIFGLRAKFKIDQETKEQFEGLKNMVAYKCTLLDKKEQFAGEGRGADWLARNQNDPNKTIKMAQKRAFIDAIIRTTGLSDIFTQDLEDMNNEENINEEPALSDEPFPADFDYEEIKETPHQSIGAVTNPKQPGVSSQRDPYLISEKQIKLMFVLAKQKNIANDKEQLKDWIASQIKIRPENIETITKKDATAIIDLLIKA